MSGSSTTRTESLIDRYYAEERELKQKALSLAEQTLHLDASDLALLNTIAQRFHKSRSDVAQEVLSNALQDLFARVEGGERKLLARDADETAKSMARNIAEDNNLDGIEFKNGFWTAQDRQLTKLEKQQAKVQQVKTPSPEASPLASSETIDNTTEEQQPEAELEAE